MNLKQFDHNIKGNGNKGCFGQSKSQKKYRKVMESRIIKLKQILKGIKPVNIFKKEIAEFTMLCHKYINKKNKHLIEESTK